MTAGVAILAMGLTMLIVRSVVFVFAARINLPPLVKEALELAPPAILTALLVNGLAFDRHTNVLDLSLGNPYLLGGIVAAVLAIWFRNVSLLTFLGFAAFLLIRHAVP